MKPFAGFPARMEFTPLPNIFFSHLLPEIEDMAELKTTLHVIALLYRKKGYPQFVSFSELKSDAALMSTFKGDEEALRKSMALAVERGTFLYITLDIGGVTESIYLLNNEQNRQSTARISSGELKLAGFKAVKLAPVSKQQPPPDIFTLYEENIGMLTPLIADQLRDAEKNYPADWIRDAVKEAVALNKRNIRYIMRILENWSAEGKTDGTHRRYSETDRDKYIKGKYGRFVQR